MLEGWINPRANGASSIPLLEVVSGSGRLSFANLVETHVLEATRRHNISASGVWASIDTVRKHEPETPHPLLTRTFRGLARELGSYFERVNWDANNDPYELFPMRLNPNKHVVLNIGLSAGHPVVAGTGVRVQHLSDLVRAGMSVSSVAECYGLNERSVAEAVTFLLHPSE